MNVGDQVLILWDSDGRPKGEGEIIAFSPGGEFAKTQCRNGCEEWNSASCLLPLASGDVEQVLAKRLAAKKQREAKIKREEGGCMVAVIMLLCISILALCAFCYTAQMTTHLAKEVAALKESAKSERP